MIVSDIAEQEKVVQALKSLFERTVIIDRRQQPSHGYRAIHVIASCQDKLVEVQVRTMLQQLWAELSEKYSEIDPAIKYGGGDEVIRKDLTDASFSVAEQESIEITFADKQILVKYKDDTMSIQDLLASMRQELFKQLRESIDRIEKIKGERDAFSD
ncbi:MAG: hypothetical protein JOZ52_13985 [Acidobacteria bacterium]|nr:hypothetical protein [Acidobacteriota bacterium]